MGRGTQALSALLLDTHAWVWWLTRPERLSKSQRRAIDRRITSRSAVLLSVISCWEVALLSERGRFRFTTPTAAWLEQATAVPGLEVVPLSLPVIMTASRLSALRDPADMLIVATAQHHGAVLLTSDARIAAAEVVTIVG
jgi:PIN domain nuclease of toxin-antitoxin system